MPVLRHQSSAGHPDAALRRHVRKRFATTVRLALCDHRILQGHTLDISLGGVQAVLPESLPLRSDCWLSFAIPAIPIGARVITVQAQVSSVVCSGRESGFLVGLRFTTFPTASRAALQRYLSTRGFIHPAESNFAAPTVLELPPSKH